MADVFMIDAVPGEEIVDIQFAVNMVKEKLPGWIWKICSCHVSDDAWVVPDFNDPVHGARLHAELDPVAFDSHFDSGFDVDRRPAGNVGQALLDALKLAMEALVERGVMPIEEVWKVRSREYAASFAASRRNSSKS